MSQAARLFLASGLSLLVGGALGAFVTRSVFGDAVEPIDPRPAKEVVCPPVKECAPCPPPVCADVGAVPTSTRTAPALAPTNDEPVRDARPGLPASAIQRASQEVRTLATTCVDQAAQAGARGIVLLDLTVTATGGQGWVSEAHVLERSPDARDTAAAEACLVEGARRARFPVAAEDGEARFRLPVRLEK